MPSTLQENSKLTPSSAVPAMPPDLSTKLPKLTPRKRQPPAQTNPQPVPETPPLPAPPARAELTFSIPTRRILSPRDHELFLASPTYDLLLSFVFSLSESVRDTPVSAVSPPPADDDELAPTLRGVLRVLDEVEDVVRACPPEEQGDSRFGNRGFRPFLDALGREAGRWHEQLGVDDDDDGGRAEVSTYFLQAFGNRTRIDYGSGHELNFITWLLCLYQLSLIEPPSFPAVVLRVFSRYLSLMRLIQSTYYLEPAGSHGVWGLDDYQFLPFLFGSSQLLHHPYIRPLSIHQSLVLEESGADYLYLGQVAFVNSVKNVDGLRWHSPMLDDISAAKSWAKVEAGMRRMFVAEVLKKLPVMQHFLFGSLVPAVEGMTRATDDDDEKEELGGGVVPAEADENEGGEIAVTEDGMRHVHQPSSWGDCCGIKVPSSVGAAQEMKKRMGGAGEGMRRIPFD
ncbi:MAG: Serine/threonine-protein phosphatase 2A activator 2 [Sclerophora amabilis]|nr:MAG: Serine/threonine-protein phosphatase 2A activator 2 [Sclerophora amabilis]